MYIDTVMHIMQCLLNSNEQKKTVSLSNSQDREDRVTSHSHVYYIVVPLA